MACALLRWNRTRLVGEERKATDVASKVVRVNPLVVWPLNAALDVICEFGDNSEPFPNRPIIPLISRTDVSGGRIGSRFTVEKELISMSTQVQALVSSALDELKFEREPGGIPGSPSVFKVTDETLKFLNDKKVTVDASGEVTVE